MKRTYIAALALACSAAPAAAQEDVDAACNPFSGADRTRCATVAQAVDAAQPQLGMLMAGGNPTLGTASTGGVRLGILPRVSAGARVNVVFARLPDIREQASDDAVDRFSVPAPAIGANVTVGVTPGMSLAPLIGGFGAVDLLGSVTVLPLSLANVDGLENNPIAWGAGARVGLLRESFVTPGVSVSLMYRDMGDVKFGDVCDGEETGEPLILTGSTVCAGDGDFGEIEFGLTNWSARGAVSKRLLGLGLTAGVGYDVFLTDANLAFRGSRPATAPGASTIYHLNNVQVDNARWSAFVDGSFTVLIASVVAEAGWMQGSDPITGFPSTSDFDAGDGTFFGSVGFRLSL